MSENVRGIFSVRIQSTQGDRVSYHWEEISQERLIYPNYSY